MVCTHVYGIQAVAFCAHIWKKTALGVTGRVRALTSADETARKCQHLKRGHRPTQLPTESTTGNQAASENDWCVRVRVCS